MVNNNELDLTFAKMAQEKFLEMRDKSCNGKEMEIPGECYVKKNNSFLSDKKKVFLTFIATLVAAGVIIYGVNAIGNSDFAQDIRNESLRTITAQELIGGQYVRGYVYDDNFVEYIRGLDDKELLNLYNITSAEMKEEGLVEESHIVEKVVGEMSSNYSEVKKAGFRN